MHDDLFRHHLQRFGDVIMPRCHRSLAITLRAKFANELVTEERLDDRSAVVPGHSNSLPVVRKIVKIQLKSVSLRSNHPAKEVSKFRLTIRSQSHHFVLVTVVRKPQVHGDGSVKETNRMRKKDAIKLLPVIPFGMSSQSTRKVTHAIH